MIVLAGDIGGTYSRLALFDDTRGARDPIESAEFSTPAAASAAELLQQFLGGRDVDRCCLGVAGAVLHGVAEGSNLPWAVREPRLADAVGSPVRLINDLEATAIGILDLAAADSVPLLDGHRQERGAIGVIAPGTGMGQAMLFHAAGSYRPVASEAGHIDFAPGDRLQAEYWSFLHERYGHVSLERACSGRSLGHLLEFLVAGDHAPSDADVRAQVAAADDAAPVVVEAGLSRSCPACQLAVQTFVAMLGAAAGNLALQIVATGGVFLAGGLPPRLLPALRGRRFADAFTSKGRFTGLMQRIPVHVVTETRCGLFGAARLALQAKAN
jgi:glucokinase